MTDVSTHRLQIIVRYGKYWYTAISCTYNILDTQEWPTYTQSPEIGVILKNINNT